MRPCIFKWLETFLKGSPLALNLHLILPGISCESHDGAKFTTQASEMDRRVPREFVDPVLPSASAFGHGLSFGELGATVVHHPSERSVKRGEPNP
jgi:hypothetical protein